MTKADDLKSKTSLPLIMAPMFLVSTPALALAACAEGVVGSFPALNQMTSAGFEQWLVEMNTGLDDLRQKNPGKTIAPYAVNLIVNPKDPRMLARLQSDLPLIVKHKVPVVITSLGLEKSIIDAIHSYGGIVLHDVTNARHAKKAIAAGVDGIIAVAVGAGGHAGTLNPIALIDEIRSFYDGLLILSGCMTAGSDILAAEALGADFAYMGTRFINTVESGAKAEHKQMIIDGEAKDIVLTPVVSGVHANFLRQSLEKAGYKEEELKAAFFNSSKLKPADGEIASWNTVWSAGQGVSNIKDTPTVLQLIDRLKKEYEAAQKKLLSKFNKPQPPKASQPPKP